MSPWAVVLLGLALSWGASVALGRAMAGSTPALEPAPEAPPPPAAPEVLEPLVYLWPSRDVPEGDVWRACCAVLEHHVRARPGTDHCVRWVLRAPGGFTVHAERA